MARKARTLAKKFSMEYMARNPQERLTEADIVVLSSIETKKIIPASLLEQRNSSLLTKEDERISTQIKELEAERKALKSI